MKVLSHSYNSGLPEIVEIERDVEIIEIVFYGHRFFYFLTEIIWGRNFYTLYHLATGTYVMDFCRKRTIKARLEKLIQEKLIDSGSEVTIENFLKEILNEKEQILRELGLIMPLND